MNFDFIANVLELLGEILIVVSVVRVHARVVHEHKIDKAVLKTMEGEQRYAIVGIVFIILAFAIRLFIG